MAEFRIHTNHIPLQLPHEHVRPDGRTGKDDNLFKRLFWPSNHPGEVDALGQQGFWICLIVGLVSGVMLLLTVHPFIGLLTMAFFWLGGIGVREHSVFGGDHHSARVHRQHSVEPLCSRITPGGADDPRRRPSVGQHSRHLDRRGLAEKKAPSTKPTIIQPARIRASTPATQFTTRSTSASEVCQLLTLTRMARFPRHVVPLNSASPVARISAITRSV